MEISDIIVFAKAGEPCRTQVTLAARLADRFRARLGGVCLFSEPGLPLGDEYAIGPAAVSMVLEDRDRKIDQSVAPVEAEFRKATEARGIVADWSVFGPDEPTAMSALKARFCDLAVVRRPDQIGEAAELAGALVLSGGAPCLIVPDAADATRDFERIVVAWDGSPTARRALDDALPLLKQASAVEVLVVDIDGLAEADERWTAALLAHFGRHGVSVDIRRVQRDGRAIGDAILDECEAFKADLLVIGAYGHSRLAEAVLGGVTRTVLVHASKPVLMAH